jgi:phosphatidylglycerophosphatase A
MHALATITPLFASPIGGWEIVLMLAVLLVLLGARSFPDLFNGFSRGLREFMKATRDVSDDITSAIHGNLPVHQMPTEDRSKPRDEFILWIAQGFGIGRIPKAPGTFGSIVGLLWFAVLLVPGSLTVFVLGILLSIAASVWFCGEAEKILGQSDPGSVVLDEIIAIPICFLPWLLAEMSQRHAMPPVETFFSGRGLWFSAAAFALFRLFDIWKPWPVRQSQHLPGGWGVTIDDVLAAFYVALCSLVWVR